MADGCMHEQAEANETVVRWLFTIVGLVAVADACVCARGMYGVRLRGALLFLMWPYLFHLCLCGIRSEMS